ncbi:type II toxin-antitoxin system VapB family antitoxin [Sphingomonas sp. AR_OL41]|uniref:type II toxin-antitoxin system VapB family antitoxin n=1 Tax=Sphingomonas sp. AR_OL41 TaxID=3042729 RepID=UPI002480B007|nr:type II toxin-antitoxin system VapB family antitoxin [Sphingomonas sp. AR_OL41]MDH7975577.1 type II toxin-antitoxin system VapB family antitoxin [Sphingomonas sp. AR_OL41]
MRIELDVDDALLAAAEVASGIAGTSALVRAALHALIEREAAKSLARLGASDPDASHIRRRRSNWEGRPVLSLSDDTKQVD